MAVSQMERKTMDEKEKGVLEGILERCENFKQAQLTEIEYYKNQIERAEKYVQQAQKEINILTLLIQEEG